MLPLRSCNWLGGHASVLTMRWYGDMALLQTPLTNITLHGKPIAAVQNVYNFTFACVYSASSAPSFQLSLSDSRVYEAGHEVVS